MQPENNKIHAVIEMKWTQNLSKVSSEGNHDRF